MIKHLKAILGLDKTGFDAGMASAGKQVNKFGENLKSQIAGAFGAAAVSVFVKQAIDFADKIKDISEQTEISTDALQAMDYAAGQSGTTLDSLVSAIKKIGQARKEALGDTSGEFAKSFERLGVSIEDLKQQRLEVLLQIISERFRQAGDNQILLADGIKILGKNSVEVFGTMKTGLKDLMDQAENSGIVASPDSIENAARYKDQWVAAGSKIKAVFIEVVSAISVAHNSAADFLDQVGKRIDLVMRLLIGGTKDKLSIKEFSEEYSAMIASRGSEKLWGRDRGPNGLPVVQFGSKTREEYAERMKAEGELLKTLKAREETLRELKSTPEQNLEFFQSKYAEIVNRLSEGFDVSNQDLIDLVETEIDIERARSKIKSDLHSEKSDQDKTRSKTSVFIEDTALGRIGAFTGAAAGAALPPGQSQQIQQLQKIHDALVRNGIIVRDAR